MSVRWTVGYENAAARALYRKASLGFAPDEDPDATDPVTPYAVAAANPCRQKGRTL
jgi:hypothetical protein